MNNNKKLASRIEVDINKREQLEREELVKSRDYSMNNEIERKYNPPKDHRTEKKKDRNGNRPKEKQTLEKRQPGNTRKKQIRGALQGYRENNKHSGAKQREPTRDKQTNNNY